jgi:phosphatidylglycerophosphatase A
MTRAIIIFLATGAYTGLVPVAPGTAGSVVGLAAAWAVLGWARAHYWMFAAVFAAVFAAGCWIAGRAEAILGKHDSSHIVLDEVMGMIATMFLNPLDRLHLLLGFVLFRGFDIVKVFPANLIDRKVRGGAGVMLDDLAAAVYANIALRFVAHLIV